MTMERILTDEKLHLLKMFADGANEVACTIHKLNDSKGFWDNRNELHDYATARFGVDYANYILGSDCVALVHTELSEGVDALRKPVFPICSTEKDSFGGELADAMIRIMDLAHRFDIPIGTAIARRVLHNSTRPHMHGGKVA